MLQKFHILCAIAAKEKNTTIFTKCYGELLMTMSDYLCNNKLTNDSILIIVMGRNVNGTSPFEMEILDRTIAIGEVHD